MRRLYSALLVACVAVAVAGPSGAETVEFKDAVLSVTISTLSPIVLPESGGATGVMDVTRSSGGAVTGFTFPPSIFQTGTFGGTLLTQMGMTSMLTADQPNCGYVLTDPTVPKNTIGLCGLLIPVTDPGAAPIRGIQATQKNAAGAFASATAMVGGTMSIKGINKVCLFASCSSQPPSNLSVPISAVGIGGTEAVGVLVNLTVKGSPWTTGMVGITKAKLGPPPTQTTMFVTGMVTPTASGTKFNLVTPIFISTGIGASARVPAFGRLLVTIPSPEPGVIGLGVAAVGGLVLAGWRKRKS